MGKVNQNLALQEEPRTGKLLTGYGPNGVARYLTVQLDPNEEICRQCEGTGRWDYTVSRDGFGRHESCKCETCDGEGTVYRRTDTEPNEED